MGLLLNKFDLGDHSPAPDSPRNGLLVAIWSNCLNSIPF